MIQEQLVCYIEVARGSKLNQRENVGRLKPPQPPLLLRLCFAMQLESCHLLSTFGRRFWYRNTEAGWVTITKQFSQYVFLFAHALQL